MTLSEQGVLSGPAPGLHEPVLRPEPGPPADATTAERKPTTRWFQPQLLAPVLGLGAWAYGTSQLRLPGIGSYGLLANSNLWFVLGFKARALREKLMDPLRFEEEGAANS